MTRIWDTAVPVLKDDAETARRAPWWAILPTVAALTLVGVLYVRQRILGVPVPTKPLTGEVMHADGVIHFAWNEFKDEKIQAHIQVAENRSFDWIAFESRGTGKALKRRRILKPETTYYWRMRAIRDDKPSPWSTPLRFHTK
ncbi:hypothetical protein ACFLSJ_04665 [Verrucomicrobiota bacterium]